MQLPTNKAALSRVMQTHVDRGSMQLMYRRTLWLLAWYYLNGARRFDTLDPTTGAITPHYLDKEGDMEFQSQDLLYKINEVVGRLQSMDVRPSVISNGTNLPALRNRAVAQILADSTLSLEQVNKAQEAWAWYFACLGGCGLYGHVSDHPSLGLNNHVEVVHPREILPFPSVGQDHTKTHGIMRVRTVPLETLVKMLGSNVKRHLDDMEWYEVDPGEVWDAMGDPITDDTLSVQQAYTKAGGLQGGGKETGGKELIRVVRVSELWQTGAHDTVERFVMNSGDHLLNDVDMSLDEAYPPLVYSRFMNNGSWWGLGMFELMFSMHRQLERMTKSLFQNIMDIDRYGVMVMPQGQFNQNQVLKEVGKGLRVMFWEPDPIAEGFSPFSITPFNAGDMPGKVAQFAREALDQLNPVRNLIEEKGRVDSAAGLGYLDEQINKSLTSPTKGAISAWGAMYKASTQEIAYQLVTSPRPIHVNNLTLDLAGAIINPDDNTVDFRSNPLPSVTRLIFTVKDVSPKSETARKQELLQLWQLGIEQDPMAVKMFALKEGLDLAMWMDDDRGAFEQSVKDILTLYADGQTPVHQLIITPYTCKPELLLRLLSGFMTGPHMRAASEEIHREFKALRETLLTWMGLVLPAAIPNPDEAALLGASMMENTPDALPVA